MARVLLVDDDEDVRYALSKYLRRAGHEVLEAGNGAQALKLIRQQGLDAVITDIVMPDCDGMELLTSLSTEFPELPVAAMSGGGRIGQGDYLQMARTLGARDIFNKPLDPELLVRFVERAVAERP